LHNSSPSAPPGSRLYLDSISSNIQSQLLLELSSILEQDNGSDEGLLTLCWGYREDSTYNFLRTDVLGSFFYPQPSGTLQSSMKKDMVVDLQRYQRQTDPRIKAASWPAERAHLEGKRPKGAIETLIYDDNGSDCQVKEGLTSNVFVVENDCLVTAPEGAALPGSMAHVVLTIAQSMGIRVERRCPTLPGTTPTTVPWEAAFLTSATKPFVPITAVLDTEGNTFRKFDTKSNIYHALRYRLRCFFEN
jgi:branched-subunit amino acid aminotransferase/4-amino-4-deoxychorismate lyase